MFEQLGFNQAHNTNNSATPGETEWRFGKGSVLWLRKNPAQLAGTAAGADQVVGVTKRAAARAKLKWRETNYLLLERGPYVIAAGLDESIPGESKILHGRFINLFDPELRVLETVSLTPGTRYFLRDLNADKKSEPQVLASAGRALRVASDKEELSFAVEGVANTPAVMLFRTSKAPKSALLDGQPVDKLDFSKPDKLLWIHFVNQAQPRKLSLQF